VDAQGLQETGGNTERAKKYHHGYSYAANGNMLSKSIINPATNSVEDRWNYTYANHAVTGITRTGTAAPVGSRMTMRYDAGGNMTYQEDTARKKTKEITFDSNNRITEVTDAAGKVVGQYAYDDQGFRVRKEAAEIINGAETKVEVLYPSMYFAIEKQKTPDGQDIANTSYAVNNIYLNGLRIAASLPNGECQYYLTDQVDSVSLVTDDKAEIVNRFEYLPFGETWITQGEGKNRPKFNSQELDPETGFYFFNARYQDPEICRFVTADNIVPYEDDTQSWNRYSYVRNNPVVYKDPTGHADMYDGESLLLAPPRATGSGCGGGRWGSANAEGFVRVPAAAEARAANAERAAKASESSTSRMQSSAKAGNSVAQSATAGSPRVYGPQTQAESKNNMWMPKVPISNTKSPEALQHLKETGQIGIPRTIDRQGIPERRKTNMQGVETKKGMDRDESPPAVFKESKDASVKHISSSDNRSAGAQLKNGIKGLPNGMQIILIETD